MPLSRAGRSLRPVVPPVLLAALVASQKQSKALLGPGRLVGGGVLTQQGGYLGVDKVGI